MSDRRESDRRYKEKNVEKVKEKDRAYRKKTLVKEAARHRRRSLDPEYREKSRVRHIARDAVKRGMIGKSQCSVCGSENSQMHHEDYTKPLEVVWLCPDHHAEVHKEDRCKTA